MKKIVYNICGENYLLVDVLTTKRNIKEVIKAFQKYECLHQSVKTNTYGFFYETNTTFTVLVPERNIKLFTAEYIYP